MTALPTVLAPALVPVLTLLAGLLLTPAQAQAAGAPSGTAPKPTPVAPATPQPLRVATWNLGWHLSTAEAQQWITECGRPFALNPADQRWAPAASGPETGWTLRWGRNAPIAWDIGRLPPCDVYQAERQIVAPTAEAWAHRQRQIRQLLAQDVAADIVAFQEVSGRQSVQDVLPDGGQQHEVCSYEGHKVQRLAIAWRKRLGNLVACEVYWPLSLPQAPAAEKPRPGLALTLDVQGRRLRVLTLHLKSSCVSPLDDPGNDQRGQLAGPNPHCRVLQAQVAPLEAWVEAQSVGVDGLVLLGDFNRNLGHEMRQPTDQPARQPGAATDPHAPGVQVHNLWRDVNDGQPASSRLQLLAADCPMPGPTTGPTTGAASGATHPPATGPLQPLCVDARSSRLSREAYGQLASSSGLGCRNPLGLDHIAVSAAFDVQQVAKVAVGLRGRTQAADAAAGRPQPLLAVSDHCPLVASLRW